MMKFKINKYKIIIWSFTDSSYLNDAYVAEGLFAGRHREDGPAVTYDDVYNNEWWYHNKHEWWRNGVLIGRE